MPRGGGGRNRFDTHRHTRTHTLDLETWDPSSLSHPFVTPTVNLSARARELELDVGTFRPNQYTILCLVLVLPSDPVTHIQIY